MTESLQERNTKYLGYLADIGVIDGEQYEALTQKCGDLKDKKLLFEISNVFANFTASDWFDLSCRIFSNWEKAPQIHENPRASNQSQVQHVEPSKDHIEEEYEDDEEVQNVRVYGNQNKGERSLKSSAPPVREYESGRNQQQSNGASDRSMMVKKMSYFCNVVEKYVYKSYFVNLKSHFDHFRYVVRNDTYETEEDDRVLMQKSSAQFRPSERSSRTTGDRDWHNKLYFDHFQKQAQLEIKREIKKAGELDHCTFTPQVNPVDPENPVLTNTLRVPVYERLLQAKPTPSNAILEKQEYRELKGATFQPDISKSQNKRKWQSDYKSTPEDRMRVATERLYGDAQIKEKIMCLRQMNQKQQENEVYTFSPNLLSPKTNKENFLKNDLTRSVDRLYDENMKRQRKLLRKEVEIREQELEECTFQPDRLAKNYKPKNESELEDLNAHERLYERFKQKRERSTYLTQDKELSQRQETSLRHRSNSVLEGKTPKKSPKDYSSIGMENVNTPAFDRLYKDMSKRKLKLNHLKDKVQKEEGTTFQPKTNWSRKSSRSISAANRSQQDIRFSSRYENKYNDMAYVQEPASHNYQDSEKMSYKRYG